MDTFVFDSRKNSSMLSLGDKLLVTVFHGVASFLGAAYVLAGRMAEALPLLERVVAQTDAMGVVFDHVLGVIPLGKGYLRAERLGDALHQARHAAEACR
jgi:hypothetical protein